MTNSHDFPAEFPPQPGDDTAPLRWAIEVVVLTALALAMLNAEAIVNWTQELPAGPRAVRALAAADAWNARTTDVGLDAPQNVLHRAWKRAKATRWPEGWQAEVAARERTDRH